MQREQVEDDSDDFKECLSTSSTASRTSTPRGGETDARLDVTSKSDEQVTNDDEEPLHIVDYTCASPFEEFILSLETFFRKNRSAESVAELKTEFVDADGGSTVAVRIVLCPLSRDALRQSTVYHHRVTRLLLSIQSAGVATRASSSVAASAALPFAHFVLVEPDENCVVSESFTRTVLSAAMCATEAAGFDRLACFAPRGEPAAPSTTAARRIGDDSYIGLLRSTHQQVVQRFAVDTCSATPPQCLYLTGIIDLFQLNIGLQSRIVDQRRTGIAVEATATYALAAHDRAAWESVMLTENEVLSMRCGGNSCVPFGTSSDPLAKILAEVQWDAMSERSVVDNSVQSSFDPAQFPGRVVRLEVIERNPCEYVTNASEAVTDAFDTLLTHLGMLCDDDEAIRHGNDRSRATAAELLALQDAIFDPDECARSPQLTANIIAGLSSRGGDGDFAAARDSSSSSSSSSADLRWRFFPNSLFSRFSRQAAKLRHADDVLDLWMVTARELAARVDRSFDPTNVAAWRAALGLPFDQLPDLQAPLVVQKLQMLSACASQLLKHDNEASTGRKVGSGSGGRKATTDGWEGLGDDDDDFIEFDALKDDEDRVVSGASGATVPPAAVAETVKDTQQQFVASTLVPLNSLGGAASGSGSSTTNGEDDDGGGARYLRFPPPLAIPVTTDQLQAERNTAESFGTGDIANRARGEVFRAQLLRDMVAFMAVNDATPPRFADFVRWHSPRDYIGVSDTFGDVHSVPSAVPATIEEESALLSERMRDPSGEWWSLWNRAVDRFRRDEAHAEIQRAIAFNAPHEASLACRWLRESLTQEDLLVAAALHVVAGAVHRMCAHHVLRSLPSLRKNANRLVSQISGEAEWWVLHGASVALSEHEVEGGGLGGIQRLRQRIKKIAGLVATLEVHVSAAVSLTTLLLSPSESNNTDESEKRVMSIIDELYGTFSHLFGDVAGGSNDAAAASGAVRSEKRVEVDGELWTELLAAVWAGYEPMPDIPDPNDDDIINGPRRPKLRPLSAAKRTFLLHALAERPINTRALPQWLLAEVSHEPGGNFKLALILSEGS